MLSLTTAHVPESVLFISSIHCSLVSREEMYSASMCSRIKVWISFGRYGLSVDFAYSFMRLITVTSSSIMIGAMRYMNKEMKPISSIRNSAIGMILFLTCSIRLLNATTGSKIYARRQATKNGNSALLSLSSNHNAATIMAIVKSILMTRSKVYGRGDIVIVFLSLKL